MSSILSPYLGMPIYGYIVIRDGYLSPLNRYDTTIDTWESIRYPFSFVVFLFFCYYYHYYCLQLSIGYFKHHNRLFRPPKTLVQPFSGQVVVVGVL